jgi:hypothetical protein
MKRILLAGLVLGAGALPADPYIEAIYPLQQFMNESAVIAEGVIEKSDLKTKTCVVKVTKSLKGKCAYTHLRMNLGAGQAWHPEVIMRHLVEGAPALFFCDAGGRAEIYINRFFNQIYGDGQPPEKAWWTFTHIEIRCNRTFNGTTEELTKLVSEILAGKAKAPAPDAKIPPIAQQDVVALPVWGQPVDPEKLPAPFRRREVPRPPSQPREPDAPTLPIKGIAYEYYEGTWEALPDFAALKPAESGTSEGFDTSKRKRDTFFALRFRGYVEVPKDGLYTFYTSSNDGSRLYIGKALVVDNDHFHGVTESAGEYPLKAGKHPITVTYFQNGGQTVLDVLWEGPGIPKQKIPPGALYHVASK